MDDVNKIRKAFFSNGQNRHELTKKFNRSWGTINRVVSIKRDDLEKHGIRRGRASSVMTEDVINAIEGYLNEEVAKHVRKKQRYTAKKIYNELTNKGLYRGSLRRVQEIVKRLRASRGQTKERAYLPLEFDLGSFLQVDHGEVDLQIDNHRIKSYLFVANVPGQVLRYCQVYPIKAKEAWGDFHERAFTFFGEVFGCVVYDNDSVLIKKVVGTVRSQTAFSLELEEHYGFVSHFCNLAAGNEKGAVENAVGYCRRNYLAGLPLFNSWDEVNNQLQEQCSAEIACSRHYKTEENLQIIFHYTV